jgi:hypothetical protein
MNTPATSDNVPGTGVQRDASGNFSAGTVTAVLNGNAVTASTLQTTRTISLSGDATSTAIGFNGSSNVVIPVSITPGIIENSDISATAAISDTKLATISSSGKVANTATTATSNNSPSTIVLRDSSGNFSANTITANLSGNASTASALATSQTISLSGDVSGSAVFNGSVPALISTSISSGAVVNADIANGAVTPAKLSTGGPSWDTSGNLNVGAAINAVSAIQSNDGTTNTRLVSSGGVAYLGATTNHPVVVQTNNAERLRVDAFGNVGIGTSSFNYASTGRTCLEVNGSESIVALKTGNIGKAYLFTTSAIASLATDQIPIAIATTGNNYIQFTTNGVGRFFINGNGTMDALGNIIANCPTTAKAWVYVSVASPVFIPSGGSYNISSITRTGTGAFTIILSQSAGTNPNFVFTPQHSANNAAIRIIGGGQGSSFVSIQCYVGTTATDMPFNMVCFGN